MNEMMQQAADTAVSAFMKKLKANKKRKAEMNHMEDDTSSLASAVDDISFDSSDGEDPPERNWRFAPESVLFFSNGAGMADIDNSSNMYCNRELNTHAPPLTMYDMQDMHNNYHESYALLDRARPKKKAKTIKYTPVLFGDLLLDLNKKKRRASKTTKLKMLMDSGTSGTIISGKHIPKARRRRDEHTKWDTRGGTFNTLSKSKIYFVSQS